MGVAQLSRILLVTFLGGCTAASSPDWLISDPSNGDVWRINELGIAQHLLNAEHDAVHAGFQPSGLAVHGETVWVSDFAKGGLATVNLVDHTVAALEQRQPASTAATQLEEPAAMSWQDDSLWVLGNDSRNLVQLDRYGNTLDELGGTHGAPPIRNAHSFDMDVDGLVYIGTSPTAKNLGLVQVWDPTSHQRIADWILPGELDDATAIALDDDGALWVADWQRGDLTRVEDGVPTLTLHGFDHPVSLITDGPQLWMLDEQAIYLIDPAHQTATRWLDHGLPNARNLAVLR